MGEREFRIGAQSYLDLGKVHEFIPVPRFANVYCNPGVVSLLRVKMITMECVPLRATEQCTKQVIKIYDTGTASKYVLNDAHANAA